MTPLFLNQFSMPANTTSLPNVKLTSGMYSRSDFFPVIAGNLRYLPRWAFWHNWHKCVIVYSSVLRHAREHNSSTELSFLCCILSD